MYRKSSQIFFMLLTCSIVLANCVQGPGSISENNDISSLLLDDNCKYPCWIGIQVGLTQYEEAKSILQQRYGLKNIKADNYRLSWIGENEKNNGLEQGSVFFVDNFVSEIFLTFDEKFNLEVKDLIEILGEPVWVEASWGGPIQADLPCRGISLQFPDQGVLAILNTKHNSTGVFENQLVSAIRIMPVPTINKWPVHDAIIVGWSGYQDYCNYVIKGLPSP